MNDAVVGKDDALIGGGGPATHAIVIGVGDYPHLIDGTGPLTDKNGGLGQLSSPPVSAFEFATWLLDAFNNPVQPLTSGNSLYVIVASLLGLLGTLGTLTNSARLIQENLNR